MDFEELTDFILYLIKEQREEDIWNIWLHKDIDKDFQEWKKEIECRKNSACKRMSKKEEKANIQKAERILGRIKSKEVN
ncbi:peptide methionine sulfoxide reductase [Clostridium niameyense]|uniref:Peptide methionine sulfoxide reductase n=1 Tax=Clostridium niameyense TaxID=1622073 RepID=A0A6M0R9P4_9CLOT|nr:peptide methionine sulfoxide reductase [Clostridium niameyense]NEZ46497.1 peptide methionine sulfoxide reductase [Clostridium niameyense]